MLRAKTVYRDYLSDKYGRYKMTFSGIHVNFSFDEKLLKKDFELSGSDSYKEHKNRVYLELAEGLVEFGWILTLLTAASPVTDSSFLKKGEVGNTCFSGKASLRCSESGYWNNFVPVLDYENIYAYVSSIKKYIKGGWLNSPSELYYPIRLKSEGENNLNVNVDDTSAWVVTGNTTVADLNAEDGAQIIDADGKTVTIVADGKTVVEGDSDVTVTVTGEYSTDAADTDGESADTTGLDTKVLDRTAFDEYYKTSTQFGTNNK